MALPETARNRLHVPPAARPAPVDPSAGELFDCRCIECGKLLFRFRAVHNGAILDIKCYRCGTEQQRTLSGG